MRRYALLLVPALFGACATVTSEDTQDIHVRTDPAEATCSLTNKEGTVKITETPGTAKVKRSFSPLLIHCYGDSVVADQTLQPRTRGRTYGNLLMLGVPAVVDASTGVGYEYAPDTVSLTLHNLRGE